MASEDVIANLTKGEKVIETIAIYCKQRSNTS